MEKEKLQTLINNNHSQREIASILECSQSNVKYYLKKYDLKTINVKNKIEVKDDEKYCPKCDNIKLKSDFYKKYQNGRDLHTYCKSCQNKTTVDRYRDVKVKMIIYKGGKCEHCPLELDNSHPAVFDFHHLDSNEKDLNFNSIKGWKWERIVEELNKCNLLCSNCHRIEHVRLNDNGLMA